MSGDFDLAADFREDVGKGASRRLRRQGKVPAVLYGGGKKPRAITLDHTRLLQQMQNEAFHTSVLTIKVGKESQAAIVKAVQTHPAKRRIWHVDFQRILADEKIRMNVPLRFIGEDVAVGVKQEGGVVSRMITEVEITCLPADLPEFLEIDISELGMDEMVYLTNIKVPGGVEMTALSHGGEDQPVAAIHMPRMERLDEEEEAAEVEGEVAAEPEEGAAEAPEEGEKPDE